MATKKRSIGTKVGEILTSIRFWILTLTAVIAMLEAYRMGGFDFEFMLNTIQLWLVAIVGIGTIDSFAVKIGKK